MRNSRHGKVQPQLSNFGGLREDRVMKLRAESFSHTMKSTRASG